MFDPHGFNWWSLEVLSYLSWAYFIVTVLLNFIFLILSNYCNLHFAVIYCALLGSCIFTIAFIWVVQKLSFLLHISKELYTKNTSLWRSVLIRSMKFMVLIKKVVLYFVQNMTNSCYNNGRIMLLNKCQPSIVVFFYYLFFYDSGVEKSILNQMKFVTGLNVFLYCLLIFRKCLLSSPRNILVSSACRQLVAELEEIELGFLDKYFGHFVLWPASSSLAMASQVTSTSTRPLGVNKETFKREP